MNPSHETIKKRWEYHLKTLKDRYPSKENQIERKHSEGKIKALKKVIGKAKESVYNKPIKNDRKRFVKEDKYKKNQLF